MDVELLETGDGGDFITKQNDLSIIYGFENMPYLSLWGGNVEASTPVRRLPTEQAFDFWGNDLEDDPSLQFNSQTERILNITALNSRGRVTIEQAVRKDLEHMKLYCQIGVQVSIIGVDKVFIGIRLIKLDNIQERDFIYIWDATIQELVERSFTPGGNVVNNKIFDFTFSPDFE